MILTQIALPVAHAQATLDDLEPPLIEHEEGIAGKAGEAQLFTATVVDDQVLQAVLLFYRFTGEAEFQQLPMIAADGSSMFNVTVPVDDEESRTIEYYIQASDSAGNRVVKGFALSPLLRELQAPIAEVAPVPTPTAPQQSSGTGRKLLYLGLGILVVGGIALALAGDDPEEVPLPPGQFIIDVGPPTGGR